MAADTGMLELLAERDQNRRYLERLENQKHTVDHGRHLAAILRAMKWQTRLDRRLEQELNRR